jgi:hypothetical protein
LRLWGCWLIRQHENPEKPAIKMSKGRCKLSNFVQGTFHFAFSTSTSLFYISFMVTMWQFNKPILNDYGELGHNRSILHPLRVFHCSDYQVHDALSGSTHNPVLNWKIIFALSWVVPHVEILSGWHGRSQHRKFQNTFVKHNIRQQSE